MPLRGRKERGREPEQPVGAQQRALGLLSRREHSTRELKSKLARKGVGAQEADAVLDDLKRADYQSDDRFAAVLIRRRAALGYGPRHIEAELRSHGIQPATCTADFDAQDWTAIATALARKRYGARLSDRTIRMKAVQFLSRRGFSGREIKLATGGEVED